MTKTLPKLIAVLRRTCCMFTWLFKITLVRKAGGLREVRDVIFTQVPNAP